MTRSLVRPTYPLVSSEPVHRDRPADNGPVFVRSRHSEAPADEAPATETAPASPCSCCGDTAEALGRIEATLIALADNVARLGAALPKVRA